MPDFQIYYEEADGNKPRCPLSIMSAITMGEVLQTASTFFEVPDHDLVAVQIAPPTFHIIHGDDPHYPSHYEQIIVEPSEKFEDRWFLEGPKGKDAWTDEELTLVNTTLVRYPPPKPYPWHGVANWKLWKKSASSLESDQRPTYSIDKSSRGQTDYVRALHNKDLQELLQGWEAMQKNGLLSLIQRPHKR